MHWCGVAGPASDTAVLGHHAQEDSELCAQCAGGASHHQRGTCRSGELGCHSGSGVRQTGSQNGLHPGVSAENAATCKGLACLLALLFAVFLVRLRATLVLFWLKSRILPIAKIWEAAFLSWISGGVKVTLYWGKGREREGEGGMWTRCVVFESWKFGIFIYICFNLYLFLQKQRVKSLTVWLGVSFVDAKLCVCWTGVDLCGEEARCGCYTWIPAAEGSGGCGHPWWQR